MMQDHRAVGELIFQRISLSRHEGRRGSKSVSQCRAAGVQNLTKTTINFATNATNRQR